MNLTDSSKELCSAVANNEDIDKMYSCWNIKLNSILHKCFRKKRVGNQRKIYNSEIKQLIKSRKVLKKASAPKKKIEKLDKVVNEKVADFNYRFIKSNSNKSGTIDKQSSWKVKRVLVPKSVSVPSSVTNKSPISDPFHIKEEYRKESNRRLRTREIDNELKHFELVQNSLCKMRLRKCSKSPSPDFTLDEVQKVLTELKSGKCRDPSGLIREVFKYAGREMLLSLHQMVNQIKRHKRTKYG